MTETPAATPMSRLQIEEARLAAEIKQIEADAADETKTAAQRLVAKNRLDTLRDDYRKLIQQLEPNQRTPGTAPSHMPVKVPMPDGSVWNVTYVWDEQQGWHADPNVPGHREPDPVSGRPPSDPSKWVQIRENPADPNSRVIAVQDPNNSGNRVTVSAGASAAKPTIERGERGQMYSWDGTTLKELIPASPEKRQIVQTAGGGLYAWDGQKLDALQPGQYQPKPGDTMQDIVQGRYVTKTYQNGQWGTTSVGKSAIPGAPEEGDERTLIQSGRNTTQTYKGGEWVTTGVGSKAIPDKPTQLQAPTDQPNIVTIDDEGRIGQQASPNFIPKTAAQIAARVGQIQLAMQQKKAEVMGKVKPDGSYTEQNALDEFNKWHAQNVAPNLQMLNAAQDEAAFARAKEQAEMRGNAMQQALAAGTLNVNAFNALREANPIGNPEAYSSVMNQIGSKMGLKDLGSAFTYQAEDPRVTAQNAVNEALKHIDPTAAAAAGAPPPSYQNIDLNQALGAQQYWPQGMPPPTLPGPAAADPNVPSDFYKQMQQQIASQPTPRPMTTAEVFGGGGAPPPTFKTGWPGSDPRLSGTLNPMQASLRAGPNPWEYAPPYVPGGWG